MDVKEQDLVIISPSFLPTLIILKLISKFLEVSDDVLFSLATLY